MFPGAYTFTLDSQLENMIQTWSKALAGFNTDEIKRGITACEETLDPPSLGRFKSMCRPPQPKQNTQAYKKFKPQLKNLKTNTTVAKAEMRLINLILERSIEEFDDETEEKIDVYYRLYSSVIESKYQPNMAKAFGDAGYQAGYPRGNNYCVE